jgi:3-isopropylmalate/(R)-2-methylmalate dehydratase large subunit
MSQKTLYDKVWDLHRVTALEGGQDQILIGLHLIHEVTTPQAFAGLREKGKRVLFPNRTFATLDHIIPTDQQARPFLDSSAEAMVSALESNVRHYGIPFFDPSTHKQGIVHVIGPELGLTQPGMTIACGDSHTSTHGAFGALAFGIGTTEVGLVLETQSLALSRLKVKRVACEGHLDPGVFPKDVVLYLIQQLGVKGGIGYAYEFAGSTFESMSMEGRMTVCNMSIEGGARMGYVNPDQTTFAYLEGREYAPKGPTFERAKAYWRSIASDSDAVYDDSVTFYARHIEPMVTWGINPAQSVGVTQAMPLIETAEPSDQKVLDEAYRYMKFTPGSAILNQSVDVVFIGSCTNSRLSDLREAAAVLRRGKVNANTRAIVVPGSQQVKLQAEAEGLHEIFKHAGAEWREAGCSMCLAMNPDKLVGDQVCASTSNRNFMGRQGSPTGRTLLMSPAMAAAAALSGKVVDVREMNV